jgi:hypothetical protein
MSHQHAACGHPFQRSCFYSGDFPQQLALEVRKIVCAFMQPPLGFFAKLLLPSPKNVSERLCRANQLALYLSADFLSQMGILEHQFMHSEDRGKLRP